MNGINFDKFECTNEHILVQDNLGDLYAVSIESEGFEIHQDIIKFHRKAQPVSTRFFNTKSANN